MAVDELNAKGVSIGGRKARFELVAEDDKLDPIRAAAVAQTLVDAGVSGVVGHLFSSTSIAASKVYCAAGIPQISPGATVPEFTRGGCKSAFRVLPDDTRMGSALGHYAGKDMRAARVAVIDDGSRVGQSIVDAFGSALTATGAKIVAKHSTDQMATDFTAILASIKAKNPDLVFFGGMSMQAGPIIKQMKQLAIRARLMGGDTLCLADLPQRAGDAWADGQVVCGQSGGAEFGAAAMGRFRVDFKARFGTDPFRVERLRVRRGPRHGRCHGPRRLFRTRQVPAGAGGDPRLQGCHRHDHVRQQGRRRQRRSDLVHLQGPEEGTDRDRALEARLQQVPRRIEMVQQLAKDEIRATPAVEADA